MYEESGEGAVRLVGCSEIVLLFFNLLFVVFFFVFHLFFLTTINYVCFQSTVSGVSGEFGAYAARRVVREHNSAPGNATTPRLHMGANIALQAIRNLQPATIVHVLQC